MILLSLLVAAQKEETARKMKMTILYRVNGSWPQLEVNRLVNGLKTEVCGHPLYPSFLILLGHFSKEETLEALLGGKAYKVTQVTGMHSNELPFKPTFAM